MKKKFPLILLVFILWFNFATANTKMVFIDMDKIIATSIPGSSLLKQLNELNEKNLVNFKNIGNELKDEEKKLRAQKNILSDDEFKNQINELRIKIKLFNDNRNQFFKEFNKIKIEKTNNFLKLINPILTAYSDENSISLIFQKKTLVIGKTELDITDIIIEIVNKNIEEIKIK